MWQRAHSHWCSLCQTVNSHHSLMISNCNKYLIGTDEMVSSTAKSVRVLPCINYLYRVYKTLIFLMRIFPYNQYMNLPFNWARIKLQEWCHAIYVANCKPQRTCSQYLQQYYNTAISLNCFNTDTSNCTGGASHAWTVQCILHTSNSDHWSVITHLNMLIYLPRYELEGSINHIRKAAHKMGKKAMLFKIHPMQILTCEFFAKSGNANNYWRHYLYLANTWNKYGRKLFLRYRYFVLNFS